MMRGQIAVLALVLTLFSGVASVVSTAKPCCCTTMKFCPMKHSGSGACSMEKASSCPRMHEPVAAAQSQQEVATLNGSSERSIELDVVHVVDAARSRSSASLRSAPDSPPPKFS